MPFLGFGKKLDIEKRVASLVTKVRSLENEFITSKIIGTDVEIRNMIIVIDEMRKQEMISGKTDVSRMRKYHQLINILDSAMIDLYMNHLQLLINNANEYARRMKAAHRAKPRNETERDQMAHRITLLSRIVDQQLKNTNGIAYLRRIGKAGGVDKKLEALVAILLANIQPGAY